MAKLTTAKCRNDWFNGKTESVNITNKEFQKSGYTQKTIITTTYSNSKVPTKSNISKSIERPSIVTSIKYEPNTKSYQTSSITTTKVANLNYQSPYKTNNLIDKSSNVNKNGYESPYQYRSPYFSTTSSAVSPVIFNFKKYSISPTSTNHFVKSTNPILTKEHNYFPNTKYSNAIPTTVTPMKISYPNITTKPIKLSSPGGNKTTNSITPLNFENFKTQLNINGNKKKLEPGKLYIFNHDEFQNPSNEYRDGSKCDVKLLKDTFKKYKVNVTLFDNYTVKKVKNQVEKIYKEDLSKNSCIVIAILSHGNRMERIAANDGSYSIHDDILFPILRNKTLEGKPKILIVQACKGDMDLRDLKTDSFQVNTRPLIPDEIYKFYSTSEGFVSYRSGKGSIFIKAFCNELEKSGSEKSIRDIMESAIKIIKLTTCGQQIPSMCVNNTEPYIFGDYL